mmetsp:Transcript_279/g.708  ORF Transcript_279/g.708 Transcript_279/m.708 type:complete len:627 (+) Transcript_279:81-1961(+)
MDFLENAVKGNPVTPAEKQLRPVLFDEGLQVLSNFEMNQVASLTYHDLSCDGIFELIESIISRPLDHTILAIQKSLIVIKHVMIYGSEKTVNHAYAIKDYITALLEFNTVLMTKKRGGAMSFFQSLQGGAIDRGGPVREAAEEVMKLLGNVNELRRIRVASASQDTIVPVGNETEVAFVTDNVRLLVLKRRIDAENRIRIQSNLKKSEGGFGAGYASKDGKSVVGAAHGIDEMIKMANIQTKKFSDHGRAGKSIQETILEELKAEADAEKAARAAANAPTVDLLGVFDPDPTNNDVVDLMNFGEASSAGVDANATNTAATVDLLGVGANATNTAATGNLLGGGVETNTAASGDLFGGALHTGNMPATTATADPFGLTSVYNTATTQSTAPILAPATNNLLDIATQNDPFATASSVPNQYANNIDNSDSMNLMSMTMGAMNTPTNSNNNSMTQTMQTPMQMPSSNGDSPDTIGIANGLSSSMTSMSLSGPPQKVPVMGSNEDRFSALDVLAETGATPSRITALDAKNAENRLLGFSSASMPATAQSTNLRSPGPGIPAQMPMGMPPPPPVPENMVAPGSGQVAIAYGGTSEQGDEDDPWVMGGSVGMGLKPNAPEPSAPPPPPPPCF